MRLLAVLLVVGVFTSLCDADEPTRGQLDFFEKKIRPVLVQRCYECHSEESRELGGNLRLDLRAGLLQGGESGPAVVPGDLSAGTLIGAIEYRDFEMPPDGKLPENVIADFKRWVKIGVPDPRVGQMSAPQSQSGTPAEVAGKLWSLQPIRKPVVPVDQANRWAVTEIDWFIQREWAERELAPVEDADAKVLLRRLTFDLVGLPPTLAQQQWFPAAYDQDPIVAVDRLTEELLGSPRFGERWGRHWLDVVRYAESTGNSRDVLMPDAWRYRDYVIDALNADVPFNRFLAEQVAGDLLPAESVVERDRLRIATGMLAVGSKSLNGGNLELDIADDQIDVIGKAVLGMTISCARCHDHKFDPIPTADYYALAGIFLSTDTRYGGGTNRPKNDVEKAKLALVLGEQAEERVAELSKRAKQLEATGREIADLNKKSSALVKKLPKDWEAARDKLQQKLDSIEATSTEERKEGSAQEELSAKEKMLWEQITEYRGLREQLERKKAEQSELEQRTVEPIAFALGVRDGNKIDDAEIRLRGEKNKRGEIVPRGFLRCVSLENGPVIAENAAGRKELAEWLTADDHPLTPRVAVNRIWQHLFGRGLVESVDNFGVNGTLPSHPELLDFLAYRFVHELDWSPKRLIREIVRSRVYRLSSNPLAVNSTRDPGNVFLWRMSRRRLEAEPLRDAMLAISGVMNWDRPEGSAVTRIGEGEVGRGINLKPLSEPFPHRSVYLPIIRGIVPEMLKLFDLPEPSNPQGTRDASNVPAQALYLMNSRFVIEQADALSQRLLNELDSDDGRIQRVYELCFAREPSERELSVGLEFVSSLQSSIESEGPHTTWSAFVQAMFASAEFRFID